MERKEEKTKGSEKLEGLPVDTSPYTQYKDLEDYKEKAYGTHGHLQPQPGRGAAASTDAPTLAGGGSGNPRDQLTTTDAVNRRGVP